jgi:hypothetical protein
VPVEIGLWRVDGTPLRVSATSIALEERLEHLIESDPAVLGHPLLLIGRQVLTSYGKYVDLLGLDADGNVHVLELKRDRTPRDVVAQALDYGSWVQDLTNDDIREIYSGYAATREIHAELDEAFAAKFGGSPPETLNAGHTLTIVAAEMDAATERIVDYLARGYGVPINVLFFAHYTDGDRSYLARTWLRDESQQPAAASPRKGRSKQEPWNGRDWYVSFGEEAGSRSWIDGRRYGFVSAGGGDWFSRTLRSLPVGARVFVHIPKVGYVGIGEVTGAAQPFDEVVLDTDAGQQLLSSLDLRGSYRHAEAADGQDGREWVVPIRWTATRPATEAFWRTGLFANQNSACKLRARFTIDEVSSAFGIQE